MKKQIPNILTMGNLFCGCLACILVVKGNFPTLVFALLCGSLILDFFDGFVARAVKASGPLGAELDSLADVVSFGFLPGLMMMKLLSKGEFLTINTLNQPNHLINWEMFHFSSLSLVGLLITLFSAYRLAKFNIDTEQAYYFKGLNTPTCTMLIFSIYYMVFQDKITWLQNPYLLVPMTLFCCVMLVSNIPMKALKFKGFSWKNNELTFIIMGFSLIAFILFRIPSIPFSILFYMIISLIFRKKVVGEH